MVGGDLTVNKNISISGDLIANNGVVGGDLTVENDISINGNTTIRGPIIYSNPSNFTIDTTNTSPLFHATLATTQQTGQNVNSSNIYITHNVLYVQNQLLPGGTKGRICYFKTVINSPYIQVEDNINHSSDTSNQRDRIKFLKKGLYIIDASVGYDAMKDGTTSSAPQGRSECMLKMNYYDGDTEQEYGVQGGYMTRGLQGLVESDFGHVQLHEALNITNDNTWIRFHVELDLDNSNPQLGVKFQKEHTKLRILKVG